MNWINKIKKFGETIKKNINKKFPTKSERESSAWTSCCKGPILKTELEQNLFVCPHCNKRSNIFNHGGAEKTANQMGIEFLGQIPLDILIRQTSDDGTPITVHEPNSEHSKVYCMMAKSLAENIASATASGHRQPPPIKIM